MDRKCIQKKVITVVSENRDPGFYSETVEMIDYNGNFLTEGIYTYHIKTEYATSSGILFLRKLHLLDFVLFNGVTCQRI